MFLVFRATFFGDILMPFYDLASVHIWDDFLCDFDLHFESFLEAKMLWKICLKRSIKMLNFELHFGSFLGSKMLSKSDLKKRSKKNNEKTRK